jgi:transposase InsO family protein
MLLQTETDDEDLSEPIQCTILDLQRVDPFVVNKTYESASKGLRTGSARHWKMCEDGLLRYRGRAYIPLEKALRSEILRMNHDDATAGHFGFRRTFELVARKYFWQSLRADVKKYVNTCEECQRGKPRRHRPYGELVPFAVPIKPWEEITMDFITDLPPSKIDGRVYDSILVIVDRFTKLSRYIPVTKTITAAELAEVFIQKVYKDFGCPKGITTDRGSVFTSSFWKTVMFYLQIRRRLSTAFHPQTDGQTERQNQVLEFYLRTYCDYRQEDWASKLALAEFTYNNSVHASTGSTPFRMLYGFNPELGSNVGDDILEGGAPAAAERIKLLQDEREVVAQKLRVASESYKKFYDTKHKKTRFRVGDLVLLSTKHLRQLRPSRKLSDKFLGPFTVKRVVYDHGQAYQLELPPTYRIHDTFHVSLLEPWQGRSGVEVRPEAIEVQGQEEYEVQSIQAHKDTRKGRLYLVRWKGYSSIDNTWEPENHLVHAQDAVRDYLKDLLSEGTTKRSRRSRR